METKQKRLWLLRPRDDLSEDDNPFFVPYGRALGFVVRAVTEDQARSLASRKQGDEGWNRLTSPWMLPEFTSCVELTPNGETEVVLRHTRGDD